MRKQLLVVMAACAGFAACAEPDPPAPTGSSGRPEASAEARSAPEVRRRSLADRVRSRDAQAAFARGYDLLYPREGAAQDEEQAHVHLLEAAGLGHTRSQGLVGINYQLGRGVERNPQEAVRWLGLAAEGGWPQAQLKLGEAYRDGYGGLEKDPVEAMKWLALSGLGGSLAGGLIARSYAAALPPDQRRAGLERAREWRIARGLPVRERSQPRRPEPGAAPPAERREAASPPPTPSAKPRTILEPSPTES